MKSIINPESGVSPVVGVMLMLVVTLIIAAVVSGFSGSILGDASKTPQASIGATYSITNGMTISHNGGDALPMSGMTFYVSPTKSFGDDASKYSWHINKTVAYLNNEKTLDSIKAFIAGDTAIISPANLTYVQERSDGIHIDYDTPDLGFMNSENIGLSFELGLKDSNGNIVSETTVTISG
jgi:FlaG/FlaF family flagellin (archaellin)